MSLILHPSICFPPSPPPSPPEGQFLCCGQGVPRESAARIQPPWGFLVNFLLCKMGIDVVTSWSCWKSQTTRTDSQWDRSWVSAGEGTDQRE